MKTIIAIYAALASLQVWSAEPIKFRSLPTLPEIMNVGPRGYDCSTMLIQNRALKPSTEVSTWFVLQGQNTIGYAVTHKNPTQPSLVEITFDKTTDVLPSAIGVFIESVRSALKVEKVLIYGSLPDAYVFKNGLYLPIALAGPLRDFIHLGFAPVAAGPVFVKAHGDTATSPVRPGADDASPGELSDIWVLLRNLFGK